MLKKNDDEVMVDEELLKGNISIYLANNSKLGAQFHGQMGAEQKQQYHSTLSFGYFQKDAKMWLKILSLRLTHGHHLTSVTRDKVGVLYMLMIGKLVNVGYLMKSLIKEAYKNKSRWMFSVNVLTQVLRNEGIDEDPRDHMLLVITKCVDVIRVKDPDVGVARL
ncbi:hypothetical protein HAX54_022832 [Datura stramonium]|uniref:Uncharacterized protein n=1 Tax=Datura stramonium TaxID=4076 RepID=A0ABS8S4N7_DATST|nr:hypothetical protein [Datura stramonium]